MSREVRQFVVGEHGDFSTAEIEALVYKLAHWFGSKESGRSYDDPLAAAKAKVSECLLATTESGDPWRNAPQEFAMRIKSKCSYDMAAGVGIGRGRVTRKDGGRVLDPEAAEGAKAVRESDIVSSVFDQDAFRGKVEHDILVEFPELDNPAHRPNVRSLSGLYAEREKIDQKLYLGVTDNTREQLLKSQKMIEEMADTTLKRLGIHPDQLRKRISDRTASTVADLVAMLDDDEDFRAREKMWALQLALQLWWMSEHPNGTNTGPNIHPFEVWHMTRTRPMQFTCRHGESYTLVEGFEPQELFAYLVANGVLVEEPVLPGFPKYAEISGITAHFTDGEAVPVVPGDPSDPGAPEAPVDAPDIPPATEVMERIVNNAE